VAIFIDHRHLSANRILLAARERGAGEKKPGRQGPHRAIMSKYESDSVRAQG
jgi:hypothetical protein